MLTERVRHDPRTRNLLPGTIEPETLEEPVESVRLIEDKVFIPDPDDAGAEACFSS
jgi:hypothetical protein